MPEIALPIRRGAIHVVGLLIVEQSVTQVSVMKLAISEIGDQNFRYAGNARQEWKQEYSSKLITGIDD